MRYTIQIDVVNERISCYCAHKYGVDKTELTGTLEDGIQWLRERILEVEKTDRKIRNMKSPRGSSAPNNEAEARRKHDQ